MNHIKLPQVKCPYNAQMSTLSTFTIPTVVPIDSVFEPEHLDLDYRLSGYRYTPETVLNYGTDINWLYETNDYLRNLDTYRWYTLLGYTYIGDVLVNNFLRGTFNFNLFKKLLHKYQTIYNYRHFPLGLQAIKYLDALAADSDGLEAHYAHYGRPENPTEQTQWYSSPETEPLSVKYRHLTWIAPSLSNSFWEHVLTMYAQDLEEIIEQAPRPTTPITVFRGVKENPFKIQTRETRQCHMLPIDGFISTSLDLLTAHGFARNGCCQRITLLPGTPCIFLSNIPDWLYSECEVLLGPRNTIYNTKERTQSEPLVFDARECGYAPDVLDVVILPESMKKVNTLRRAFRRAGNPMLSCPAPLTLVS